MTVPEVNVTVPVRAVVAGFAVARIVTLPLVPLAALTVNHVGWLLPAVHVLLVFTVIAWVVSVAKAFHVIPPVVSFVSMFVPVAET